MLKLLKRFARAALRTSPRPRDEAIPGSEQYWIERYASGRTSGRSRKGKLAQFKADVINEFVQRHGVRSVIEYGCGAGDQLKLANYPAYIGFDVSSLALARCQEAFRMD